MTTMDLMHSAAVILITGLLSLTIIAYLGGLFVLMTRRRIPLEVMPPRVAAFGALALCAAKVILGTMIAQFQAGLTGLVVLGTIAAVYKMVEGALRAFNDEPGRRRLIHRWSAVLIPPMSSIGLLGILDTLPDQDHRILITAFMTINLIPALYVLMTLKSFFVTESVS